MLRRGHLVRSIHASSFACAASAVSVCLLLTGPLMAQPSASTPRRTNLETVEPAELAQMLDDNDYAARERAESLLLSRDDVPLGTIETLLKEPRSAEAVMRLERAGFNRFSRTPRGALGVQFDSSAVGRTVIENTTPGFDSGRVLKPGDEIIAIEGEAVVNDFTTEFGFSNRNPIRPMVISRDPGQRITISVKRRGEVMDFQVELGSFDRLRVPNLGGLGQSLDERELMAGWTNRLKRLRSQGGGGGEGGGGQGRAAAQATSPSDQALDLRFTDQAWHHAGSNQRGSATADDRQSLQHALQLNGQLPSVVAGGQPRFVGRASPAGGYGANFNFAANTAMINNGGRVQIFQGLPRREIQPGIWVDLNDVKPNDLPALRAAISQQRLMIEQWRNMANRANDAQTAAAINEQIRIFEKQMIDLQRQLTQIRQGEKPPITIIRPEGEKPRSPQLKPGLDGKDGPATTPQP